MEGKIGTRRAVSRAILIGAFLVASLSVGVPAALTQGQVDAIAPTEPFVTVSTSQDGQILANYFAEIRDNVAIAGFISTEDWINKNRDVAQAFHRA